MGNHKYFEYPIDDDAFLFSIDNKRIFQARKGKNKICWINSDEFGLCFYGTLNFNNHFITIKNDCEAYDFEKNLINCHKNDLFLKEKYVFTELEVFKII